MAGGPVTEPTNDCVTHYVGTQPGKGKEIWDSWLKAIVAVKGSDLIIKCGVPPRIRHKGALVPLKCPAVNPGDLYQMCMDVLDASQQAIFKRRGQYDFAYDLDGRNRFRVNIFMARGKPSLAARLISSQIRRFEELYLPAILGEVSMNAQGLILLAGVTGSGKSTTIAAMLQYVNERKKAHIVTLEDPIEYVFTDDQCTINQREIGIDCANFNEALRALVRENPDIVLVGEMRDKETFEAAVRAAETGHLVFGTIHASSAWQTLGRILELFPQQEREQIRKLLAYNLRAIIYQKLLPTLHPNIPRIPGLEIMLNTPSVQKYILEEREGELLDIIRKSHSEGMIDFTSSLVKLVEQEYVHVKVALEATPKPEELKMKLKGIA